MADHITDLDVSINQAEEIQLEAQDYTQINVNLNQGTKGDPIFLWYKKGGHQPITKLQLTYNNPMAGGLTAAGYIMINKNLNTGAGGDDIYLWHRKGTGKYNTPIMDIFVSTGYDEDAQYLGKGWERLGCDLNRNDPGAPSIHILVKRSEQTFICDVTATGTYRSDLNLFHDGYIRLDEDTNSDAGGADVFIWYRQTNDRMIAITDLRVSTIYGQYQEYEKKGYMREGVNLNKGTDSDNEVFLWAKKHDGVGIVAILLPLQKEAVLAFMKAGITVIEEDLNAGTKGSLEYIGVRDWC